MKTPWFMAEGETPAVAWDSTGKWSFSGSSTEHTSAKIKSSLFFPFVLSSEQVATATRIIKSGQAVAGRYETWEQFAQVHRVAKLTQPGHTKKENS